MRQYEPLELTPLDIDTLEGGDILLQSGFWGRFKEKQGWEPRAFKYRWRDLEGSVLVLVRRLFRFLPMAYVPFGPNLPDEERETFLSALSWELVAQLPIATLFVRYDLKEGCTLPALEARNAEAHEPVERPVLSQPMRKAGQDIQPPDTVILSLDKSLDDLLADMHKKWRYNIRLAEKKGVTISVESQPNLEEWYNLYRTTGERDKIALHPQSYYQRLFDLAAKRKDEGLDAPKLYLLSAHHEGDYLAGIIVSIYGKRATYMYGASSNHKRNLMPAYALQWQGIKLAKEALCSSYDFFGLSPKNDPSHPMNGLFLFKTGFGGEMHHNLGAWDFVYGKLFYGIYRMAEAIRLWYYKKFKKRG